MKELLKALLLLSIMFNVAACASGGKPAVMVEHYALEYAPPAVRGLAPIPVVIGVERFSVAQIFNHAKIIYRQAPYQYNDYAYDRWRANPADMIGDCLLRDLRAAGVFKSVFSYRDEANPPLLLQGGVGEFYENDVGDGRFAVLSVDITLLDTTQKEFTRQVVFQKNYRYEEPLTEKTVPGFAGAMSRAARKLSGQMILDIHSAISDRKK